MDEEELDINKDNYSGDINDFAAALSMLSETYSKRFNKPTQVVEGAIEGAKAGFAGGPFGVATGMVVGGTVNASFNIKDDEEIKKQESVIAELAKQYGLNSDETKALIEGTKLKAQFASQNSDIQNKANQLLEILASGKIPKQGLNVDSGSKDLILAGVNPLIAGPAGEQIDKERNLSSNSINTLAKDIGLDISKIKEPNFSNPNDVNRYRQQVVSELEKTYDETTGQYNLTGVVQPNVEEKQKISQANMVENKILNVAQNKDTASSQGLSASTGVDMSIPSGGTTSGTTTLADGTTVPNSVDTNKYNSFLNADDPNAFIGITDPSGKTQTIDKNGQVVSGVAAQYQYKDVMGEKGWNGLDEAGRVQLKKFLYAGNFYGSNDVLNLGSGNITDSDVKALTSAMAASNINGVDYGSYLKPMYEEFLYTGRPFGEKPVDLNGDGKIDEYDQNNATALKGFLKRNGIEASEDYIASYDKAIRSGATTLSDAQNEIRSKMIAPAYSGYAEQINQGMDLETIASPYKAKISSMLGISENMLDLNDPLLKSMVNNKNEEGKPTYTTLEDAEQLIRKDPRWRASSKAQTEVASGMYQLMQRFGIF